MQQDLFYPQDSVRKVPNIITEIKKKSPKGFNSKYPYISYSQMNVYNTCNYRWNLEYKLGNRRFTSSVFTTFGTAIHETLQTYLDILYNHSEDKANDLDWLDFFKRTFKKVYEKDVKDNNGEQFITKDDFVSFYNDGLEIIKHFIEQSDFYFGDKNVYLVGCELPISYKPSSNFKVKYRGFLDIVLYNQDTGRFKIVDIKTSTMGWNKYMKADESKQNQLLLYKKYFSKNYKIDEDSIDIEFFILRRKLYENTTYNVGRIQIFTPESDSIKTTSADNALKTFISECFDKEGAYLERDFEPNPSKKNCKYCPFSNDKEMCEVGVKS